MGTVTTSAPVSFDIGPFQTVQMQGAASATGTIRFTSLAPKLQSDSTGTLVSKTYGPFGAPMTVSISATSGEWTYTIGNADGLGGPVNWSDSTRTALTDSNIKARQFSIDRLRAKRLMTSPPTPTFTTSLTIASPLHWPANSANAVGGACFSYFRGGNPTKTGASYPDDEFVGFPYISYGTSPNFNTQSGVSFMHDGRYLEIKVKGNGGRAMIKINDGYLSLTPQTLTNDGSIYYWYFDFGSRAVRRIDIIGYSLRFGGVYTQQTDSIWPAPRRGPRCILVGDSFTEGTGATQPSTLVWEFAEQLGWDDVWASGIGGSGYLAGPSTNPTLRGRLAADVIAYNPQMVVFCGGINDSSIATQAEIYAEALTTYQQLQTALPSCRIVVCAPFWKGGACTLSTSIVAARAAVKAAATAAGVVHIDPWELPLKNGTTPLTTTLSSSASANATSISTAGPLAVRGTYAFNDGTRFQVKATSGSGPYTLTIDSPGLQVAQSSGAAITQVGDCIFTGNGKVGSTTGYGNADLNVSSDGTHPSPEGHAALGQCLADLVVDLVPSVG